jgi:hypothetical protein
MKLRIRLIVAAVATLAAGTAFAAADAMAPGVLVDSGLGRAYVADVDGRTQALTLAEGRALWASAEVALPLAERDGTVYALGQPGLVGVGTVLLLDAGTGVVRDRIAFDLPEHVEATVVATPKGRFSARLVAQGDALRLYWEHVAQPLRGAYEPGASELRVDAGALDLRASGARVVAVPVADAVDAPAAPAIDVAADRAIAGLPGRQFRGAGDAAVLASEPVQDARYGLAWRWTFQSRTADAPAGSLVMPQSMAPFALVGDELVLFRADAFGVRTAEGREQYEPTRLVLWDLAAGRERWRLPVLDPVYRGTLPP